MQEIRYLHTRHHHIHHDPIGKEPISALLERLSQEIIVMQQNTAALKKVTPGLM